MSADDWEICPRCLARAKAEQSVRLQAAADAYGKVVAAEYERLLGLAYVPLELEPLRTFREDYEFYGVSEGKVVAKYSGHCNACGLGLDFKDEHEIPGLDEDAP